MFKKVSGQNIVSRLIARFYPKSFMDELDAAFCDLAKPGMKVLDAGCGGTRGCSSRAPLEKIFIVGVDLDPAVLTNPYCNEKYQCDLADLPFDNASFDLIQCRWVLEHLRNPTKVLKEFARVLKPGGKLIALTPNVFHYAMVVTMLTPHWFHCWWWQGDHGHFPTYYRANSPKALHRICKSAGLRVLRMEFIEKYPYYFERFWPAFLCGVIYERLVNSTPMLKRFRQRILLEAISPSRTGSVGKGITGISNKVNHC